MDRGPFPLQPAWQCYMGTARRPHTRDPRFHSALTLTPLLRSLLPPLEDLKLTAGCQEQREKITSMISTQTITDEITLLWLHGFNRA